MSDFHHVLHVVFHRLSFDWSSFNDIVLLCPLLLWCFNESAPPAVCLHQPVSSDSHNRMETSSSSSFLRIQLKFELHLDWTWLLWVVTVRMKLQSNTLSDYLSSEIPHTLHVALANKSIWRLCQCHFVIDLWSLELWAVSFLWCLLLMMYSSDSH